MGVFYDLPPLLCQMTIIVHCGTLIWFVTSLLSVCDHDAVYVYPAEWRV